MHRFYIEGITKISVYIITDKKILNQFIKVLRFKTQDFVIFFNGTDYYDYVFQIVEINNKQIKLNYNSQINKNINNLKINLFQAIPNKLSKIEFILQKGTEVGINSFNFFCSDRSNNLKISESKLERLKKIIIESTEQSGRNNISKLNFEKKLNLDKIKMQNNIVFHTKNSDFISLNKLDVNQYKEINIFVGPEGGFSENEINIFTENGFKKVYLGNNILRTETTGVVTSFYLLQSFNK